MIRLDKKLACCALDPDNVQKSPTRPCRSPPQHVVQRGNDRQWCFSTEGDYIRYLQNCANSRWHANAVLMTNVHLLITPAIADGAGGVMQAVTSTHPVRARMVAG